MTAGHIENIFHLLLSLLVLRLCVGITASAEGCVGGNLAHCMYIYGPSLMLNLSG